MKPTTPLLVHNAAKTHISGEQRRWRFHLTTKSGPQRCQRFQPGKALHRIGKHSTRQHTIAATSPLPRNFARNPIGKSINKVVKRRNSNDLTSIFERVVGELRAKLGAVSAAMCAGAGHEACGVKARPGRASRRRAEPKARGADGSRAGRHPPAHTATRHHWYGGRRRVRRARAGFEIDHSEPSGSRVAISRAGRPRGGRRSVGATSNSSRRGRRAGGPPPTGTHSGRGLRRPEHQRHHKKHSTGARARRPAPLDATTQTRTLRSTDAPCRSARAARRSRRSSRSPRLQRRAGPRR